MLCLVVVDIKKHGVGEEPPGHQKHHQGIKYFKLCDLTIVYRRNFELVLRYMR
jgi:hypothetical protein